MTATSGTILLADPAHNRVVSIFDNALTAGQLFVSPDATTYFGTAGQTTGIVTPYIAGVGSPHGFDFIAVQDGIGVPEPPAMTMLATGLAGLPRLRRKN